MEDSFKVRVDRAFGSLEASSSSSTIPITLSKSPSSSLSSLWCLSDQEIERKEWIRDKLTPLEDKDEDVLPHKKSKPYSSFLEGILANPQQSLAESFGNSSTSHQDLESDIQELDDEDGDYSEGEENQQPQPDDRSNEEWTIRSSVGMDCTLDNEEEEDAYDKVAVGKEESIDRFYMRNVNDYEVEIDSNNELPNTFGDAIRDPRANHIAAKLRLEEDDESGLQVDVNLKSVMNDNGKVPDYIRNPSKYTHYTFDDSVAEEDEESNRKAYMDFVNMMKGSNAMETEGHVSSDSPASIIFTPKKKKVSDGKLRGKDYVEKKVHASAIDGEICAMDEDEAEMETDKSSSLRKAGRRYRTRGGADADAGEIVLCNE